MSELVITVVFDVETLAKLDCLHEQQEMHLGEVLKAIAKSIKSVEDAVYFAETMVTRGNSTEVRVR